MTAPRVFDALALDRLPFDFASLRAAYADGLTAAAAIGEAYRRIRAADDPGIFLHLVPEDTALAEAEALGPYDPSRPLWGLPFAVKDNIDLAGAPTTAACPAYAYRPAEDAFVVAALRRAGAIPVGKTNLDQFATGLVGTRTPHPIPRNAVDPAMVPGGSSSGSAVAAARGLVAFALGTDTAGSGRVPAALNNIVGLKPTLGALSARGVVPACRTLDTVSIFALTVADAHAAFRAAALYDPEDAYARPVATPPLRPPPPHPKIGVPDAASREFCGDTVQAAAFAAALERLAGQGAEIVEIDFDPFYQVARMLYEGAWVAERHTVIEELLRRDPEAIHPVTRQVVGKAEGLSAADAFRGFYRLAELKRHCAPALASVDLLCVPTIPTVYGLRDLAEDPIGPNSRLGTYTNFVNLLDLCGLAVPMAPRADGRPGSVTLLASAGRDDLLAGLGAALHRDSGVALGATGWPQPPAPPLPDPADAPDRLTLAMVGAHMSGLPLNGEVTRRGGRFLEAVHTAPDYRFYALPGDGVARPGLVRVAAGGGSIAAELWSLPLTEVGSFLRDIPAPLGLGTLRLADGRSVQGFLCEAAATTDARDITALGGWRAYLAG